MMNTPDSIKEILTEQISGYHMLQCLLQREKICLININLSQIEDLSKEKDTIVMRLRLLEEERKKLTKKYFADKGIYGEINLNMLSKDTGDDAYEAMRLQIISLLQSLAELNEFNRILIDRSVNFLKNAVGFLDSAGLKVNYAQRAQMMSREA